MENKIELTRPLIMGHGRDGRCLYDPEAKQELVKACLQPGVSIAKTALHHGINANLLRKWISQSHHLRRSITVNHSALPAFAPVMTLSTANSVGSSLNMALPNGVKLELQAVSVTDVLLLLNTLATLPCSVSKPI
ncbi:MAG: transposase [Methylococcales bacterium]|nr:transposase [Methylococcales bacterium]